VVCGDFNHLPVRGITEQFGLRTLVDFTTYGNAMLDLILTDISEYDMCEKIAPTVNNDHCCVLLKGKAEQAENYIKLKRRIVTPEPRCINQDNHRAEYMDSYTKSRQSPSYLDRIFEKSNTTKRHHKIRENTP